ncbi:DNA gyrase subunit A, partial [Candidatus Woesearchaeota archaeon]|nr:DNA gyrase subunit A [Candidatus Woesearchaeota archaeon]
MSEEENTVIPKVIKKVIEDEMKESYMAYSMSVIVGRALPDIRDGLKPVHRRIMFAMHDLGMFHNKPFKKSARIVGEVLGKYHPHGDTAVYDSMVRMAQPFSLRYPLIQGQGNFGSVDGDSAASMRYTEARLSKVSEEILEDIDKDTVDFIPNFDGSLEEPSFLPCKLPNLLINGSSGIAVGMATNIPPHNLTEVCEGTIKLIDEPECDFEELVSIVKGPDFPTGGTIVGRSGIRSALAKGRGKVRIKANTFIEEKNNRKKIIVNEIPYMVNKSQLLIQIAACVKDKRILGISDLRDESDREGMRIVIELKQNANEQVVLNQLFKHTRLQDTFGIIMLSIVNNEPKVLNLRSMLKHFINHRKNVVTRRTQYELRIAQEREHILRGVVIALDDIDEIIQKIKKSKTVKEASEMLQSDYSLSEKQSKAILEMRLQKLSSLEQQKVRDELTELENRINALKAILADEQKILDIIKSELNEIKEKYGDERKTAIDEAEDEDMEDEDLIKEEEMVITLTNEGYIKRLPVATYRAQRRGGQGVKAATTKDEDFVEELFVASTHAYLLIFTDKGKVYWKKVYKIPEASRIAKGLPIINLIEKEQDEKGMTVIPVRHFEKG